MKKNSNSTPKPVPREITSILKKKNKEFFLNQYLIKAVEIGDLTEVKRLIQEGGTLHKLSGMQLHKYNSEHDTLLHIAIKLGHADIVEYLIEHDCDINTQSRRYRTPLHYATYPNVPVKVLEILLKNNADLESKDDDNASAFMWACYLNNIQAVKLLISHKADAYAADNFGLTPLEWASHQGNLETVKVLTQSLNYSKAQLASAYAKALENGQTQTANFLGKKVNK